MGVRVFVRAWCIPGVCKWMSMHLRLCVYVCVSCLRVACEKTVEHLHACASRWVFVGILIGVLILSRFITYLGLRFVKHLDR